MGAEPLDDRGHAGKDSLQTGREVGGVRKGVWGKGRARIVPGLAGPPTAEVAGIGQDGKDWARFGGPCIMLNQALSPPYATGIGLAYISARLVRPSNPNQREPNMNAADTRYTTDTPMSCYTRLRIGGNMGTIEVKTAGPADVNATAHPFRIVAMVEGVQVAYLPADTLDHAVDMAKHLCLLLETGLGRSLKTFE